MTAPTRPATILYMSINETPGNDLHPEGHRLTILVEEDK